MSAPQVKKHKPLGPRERVCLYTSKMLKVSELYVCTFQPGAQRANTHFGQKARSVLSEYVASGCRFRVTHSPAGQIKAFACMHFRLPGVQISPFSRCARHAVWSNNFVLAFLVKVALAYAFRFLRIQPIMYKCAPCLCL
jgi:hypothetical protein